MHFDTLLLYEAVASSIKNQQYSCNTPSPPKKHLHVHQLKKTLKIFIILNNWIITCVLKFSNQWPCGTVT